MAKRVPRVTDPSKPPPNAVYFDVWRLAKMKGTTAEGKRYTTYKPERMTGGVGPDSRVADRWLVAELSPEAIVQRWGSGRYRIRYLGASYDLVGSVDWELQAAPDAQGQPLAPAEPGAAPRTDGSPASRIREIAGSMGGAGVVELMLLLNDTRESAARQAREESDRRERQATAEADRRAQRDQQFFDRVLSVHQAPAAAAAAAGPPVDMTRELALLRRELALEVREQGARLRAEVLSQIPEAPDPGDGAESVAEALNGAGVALVEGVGEQMPEFVGGLLGKLKAWMKMNGQEASPEAMAKLIASAHAAVLAESQANGAGQA